MKNDSEPEDIQNLISWLQEILKELQVTRGAALEMRDKVNLIPEIKDHSVKISGESSVVYKSNDDLRAYLDSRFNNVDAKIAEIRNNINDLKARIDKLR